MACFVPFIQGSFVSLKGSGAGEGMRDSRLTNVLTLEGKGSHETGVFVETVGFETVGDTAVMCPYIKDTLPSLVSDATFEEQT